MTKDGIGVILAVVLAVVIFSIGAYALGSWSIRILAILSWIFLLFTLFFFRDPNRTIPTGEGLILSAGDGEIIEIKEVHEDQYLKSKARQVSIFLSILDVHVNRIPISGKVGYFNYIPGKFHRAYKKAASGENEQTFIGIENEHVKIVVKQVAGIIARRIVCHIREGNSVTRGERFGMIRFGSRVDMILPLDAEIQVNLGRKVKGGETVIAKYEIH